MTAEKLATFFALSPSCCAQRLSSCCMHCDSCALAWRGKLRCQCQGAIMQEVPADAAKPVSRAVKQAAHYSIALMQRIQALLAASTAACEPAAHESAQDLSSAEDLGRHVEGQDARAPDAANSDKSDTSSGSGPRSATPRSDSPASNISCAHACSPATSSEDDCTSYSGSDSCSDAVQQTSSVVLQHQHALLRIADCCSRMAQLVADNCAESGAICFCADSIAAMSGPACSQARKPASMLLIVQIIARQFCACRLLYMCFGCASHVQKRHD